MGIIAIGVIGVIAAVVIHSTISIHGAPMHGAHHHLHAAASQLMADDPERFEDDDEDGCVADTPGSGAGANGHAAAA